jgi:hypothetical protein
MEPIKLIVTLTPTDIITTRQFNLDEFDSPSMGGPSVQSDAAAVAMAVFKILRQHAPAAGLSAASVILAEPEE